MTRPGDEVFRTHPADAILTSAERYRLSATLECALEGLVDATTIAGDAPGLHARLSQPDSEDACRAVGGRLPTHAEVLLILEASHLFPPRLGPFDHLMASRRRCEEHDAEIRTMARDGVKGRRDWPDTPPWDGKRPLGNAFKWRTHIPGMNPRMDEAITGWRKRDGSLWQKGGGPIPLHHGPGAAFRTDYGTGTIPVFDVGISMPPAPADPRPPGAPMRSTIKLGSRGADVGLWQRIIGATPDEIFGPGTDARTRIWQQAHDLHADGVVGPQTWRAAGEDPAVVPVSVGGPSLACRRALRDADATWPTRKRASDGIMGDASHQARPSDHNLGNAVDITHDPASGCDGELVAMMGRRDPRVAYVIWNRRIWSRARDGEGWRAYSGANPHTHHVHISVRAEARDDASSWPWAAP